ncbi:MAG: NAD(+) synthase [Candidatus Woesearchaeota archaeon]|jgi:NAD+ synthetase
MIDSKEILKILDFRDPNINLEAKVDPNKVVLPQEYKNKVIELLRRSFYECKVEYCNPSCLVVPLSGGLDSSTALVASVAAVGLENTRAVLVRHKYMIQGEKEDAYHADRLVSNLNVRTHVIDVSDMFRAGCALFNTEPFVEFQDDPFLMNLFRTEILVGIRKNIMDAYCAIHSALSVDTSNLTEICLGNFSQGSYMGAIDIFGWLLKSEVYKLAEELGVPSHIQTRAKTMSEFSGTYEQMYGVDHTVLDPIVHRYLNEENTQTIINALGHPCRWVEQLYKRMDETRFRLCGTGPSSQIISFWEDRKKDNANWIKGIKDYWSERLTYCDLACELHRNRNMYMP